MLKFIIICIVLIVSFDSYSQRDINYNHKSIIKSLTKFEGTENLNQKEIIIPDSIVNKYKVHGKYFSLSDSNYISPIRFIYIGRVNSCRTGGCSTIKNPAMNEEYEYFDYFILYDSSYTIKLVKVFNYQATHGQEVTSKGWLKQFIGYDGSIDLLVGKDIDAISGATISVYGITFDVQLKTEILKILTG